MNMNIQRDFQICISVPWKIHFFEILKLRSKIVIKERHENIVKLLFPTICIYHFHVWKQFLKKQYREVFREKGILKNFTKFTGKHLCWSLFFNIVAGLRPTILLKKRLQHRCFPVNFVKFSRTPFFYRTPPVAAFVFNSSGITGV